jgi:adenylate cyclase
VRTANLAIVFTDIKGFTERTSRQTLEQNEMLLTTHNELLAPLFKNLGGRIVKTIGDAFMVTFESPTSAVLAGIAVQDALWKYNQSAVGDEQLHVRVAINVGEVRLEGNDVFGEPVNIAARVEGIAEADEVTFTEAVYLSMNRAELATEEVGRFDLKGIPEPIRLFRVSRVSTQPGEAPYGNKGLAKAAENTGSHKALELASSAASSALQSTSRVLESTSKLMQSSLATAQQAGLPKRNVLLGVGAAMAVLVLLFVALGKSDVERAIDEAARAKTEERRGKIEAAKKLINAEKETKQRSLYLGLLSEKLGEAAAASHYVAAARAGSRDAEGRLIDLLAHAKCPVRAAAADGVADLQLKRARGKLEDLAEDGGPDDGEQVLIFGCNSKAAAATALKRLKD